MSRSSGDGIFWIITKFSFLSSNSSDPAGHLRRTNILELKEKKIIDYI